MDQIEKKDLEFPVEVVHKRKLTIGMLVLVGLLLLKWISPDSIPTSMDELLMRLNKTTHSFWNPVIFVGVYAAAITIGIPGTPITIAGGAIFGTPWGIILNTVGANLGANLSFFIARKLGRNTIKKIFKYDLGVYSDKTRTQDFWRLLSLRLFPLVPFTALNFACGFTRLRWRTYFLATAFGMLPWTILYTMFADTALDAYGEYSMDIVGKLLLLIAIILISLKMSVFFRRNRK
tara:strand:+ start:147 stop:848 length:702 start_codon:yes stop_codon:yes gene_type:complete